jgi:hypothetical protein
VQTFQSQDLWNSVRYLPMAPGVSIFSGSNVLVPVLWREQWRILIWNLRRWQALRYVIMAQLLWPKLDDIRWSRSEIISTSNVFVKLLSFPNHKGGEAIDARMHLALKTP